MVSVARRLFTEACIPLVCFRGEDAEECARRVHSGDFLILYAATVKGNASL